MTRLATKDLKVGMTLRMRSPGRSAWRTVTLDRIEKRGRGEHFCFSDGTELIRTAVTYRLRLGMIALARGSK